MTTNTPLILTTTLKYAIAVVTDQTISYVGAREGDDPKLTTKHPEAHLWDDVADASMRASELSMAQALFLKNGDYPGPDEKIVKRFGYWVEAVPNETEFQARKDTW